MRTKPESMSAVSSEVDVLTNYTPDFLSVFCLTDDSFMLGNNKSSVSPVLGWSVLLWLWQFAVA